MYLYNPFGMFNSLQALGKLEASKVWARLAGLARLSLSVSYY